MLPSKIKISRIIRRKWKNDYFEIINFGHILAWIQKQFHEMKYGPVINSFTNKYVKTGKLITVGIKTA